MNPLALLLPIGLVVWFVSSQGSKKGESGSSGGAGAGGADAGPAKKEEEPFLARSEDYTDRNNVVWILSNPFPSVWQAKVKNDPKGYPGYEKAWDESVAGLWQPKGSTRAEVVNLIDGLIALGTKVDIQKDLDEGKEAGIADANQSIQAYKDSITGYHVHPVYPRWKVDANQAWKDSYNKEFTRQLYRYNYKVQSEGPCCEKWYIVKGVSKYETDNFASEYAKWLKSFFS